MEEVYITSGYNIFCQFFFLTFPVSTVSDIHLKHIETQKDESIDKGIMVNRIWTSVFLEEKRISANFGIPSIYQQSLEVSFGENGGVYNFM